MQETNGNVVFSYSGSINTSGLGTASTSFTGNYIIPNSGIFAAGQDSSFENQTNSFFDSVQISGPTSFGTGGFNSTTLVNGDFFVLANQLSGNDVIGLPNNYVSGSTFSGSLTFVNNTFFDLGVDTSQAYIWTLSNNDTITLQATPVPLESDALPIVGSALFMAGGLWWKKKRAQAKVAEFVVKK